MMLSVPCPTPHGRAPSLITAFARVILTLGGQQLTGVLYTCSGERGRIAKGLPISHALEDLVDEFIGLPVSAGRQL